MVAANGSAPLYVQVADSIRNLIEVGSIPEGGSIGSQEGIAERYRVSRVTVRQAVKLLEKDGLVSTRQGKGSFVCAKKFSQELDDLVSLADVIEGQGCRHSLEVRDYRWMLPPARVLPFVGEDVGRPVLLVKRLHLMNGVPIAFSVVYLPAEVGLALTKQEIGEAGLYSLTEGKLRIMIGEAKQFIRAEEADAEQAEMLGVKVGSALLSAERITYSLSGEFISHVTFYYRPQYYEFRMHLRSARVNSLMSPPLPGNRTRNPANGGEISSLRIDMKTGEFRK